MRSYDELFAAMLKRHDEEVAKLAMMRPWLEKVAAEPQPEGAELYFFSNLASIHMTGTKADLVQVLRTIRAAGLEIADRDIGQTKAIFCARPEGSAEMPAMFLQIHFSSTECKLVPKGTKTVEVADYEVDCGGESLEDVA